MTATAECKPRPGFDYAAVIGRCAEGDRHALRELYERDAGAMRNVAARILGRRELAEDAVHDAFVQIWLHARRFDTTRGTGRSWLLAIVRYRALNMRRSGAREELVDADPRSAEADDRIDAESALIVSERIRQLAECLDELKPRQREALLLSCALDLSHSEVAARLGLPLGTAKSWILRGRQFVRQSMQAALTLVAGLTPSLAMLAEAVG